MLTRSPGVIKAMEDRIGKKFGINPASIMLGAPGRKFQVTAQDEAAASTAMTDILKTLNTTSIGADLEDADVKAAASDPELKKYMDLIGSGTTDEINAQKAKLTGGSAVIAEAMGKDTVQLGGSLDKIRDVEGQRAMSKRAMVAGGDLERVLAGSGVDGKGMLALGALAKGDIGADTLAGLGNISLSKEQRAALKAKGVSETIMKALDADSSGKGLEALVGKDEAKKLMEGGLTAEELGSARLSGMMGEGIGGRVTMSKNGGMLTTSEAKSAAELATQMDSIAKSSLALADVVSKLQEKQKGWFG
jgi:hypothetical protein